MATERHTIERSEQKQQGRKQQEDKQEIKDWQYTLKRMVSMCIYATCFLWATEYVIHNLFK